MTPQQSQKQPAPGTPETLCTTCARADVNCPIYPQQTTRCVEHRAAGQQQPDHIADATEMVQAEPVNQQMLAALQRIGGMTMSMYVSAGEAMSDAKRLANEAIAAAEQAQQPTTSDLISAVLSSASTYGSFKYTEALGRAEPDLSDVRAAWDELYMNVQLLAKQADHIEQSLEMVQAEPVAYVNGDELDNLQSRIDTQQARIAELESNAEAHALAMKAGKAMLAAETARADAAEQDAARYRWLREQAAIISATDAALRWEWESGEYGEPDYSLDRFIDAAMQTNP